MSNNKSAGHRRQVKFSGLVSSGVVTPNKSDVAPHFASTLQETSSAVTTEPTDSLVVIEKAEPTDWELVDNVVVDIDTNLVDDSPYQLAEESRDRYDPEAIDQLANTMAAAGQQEPIKVRWVRGRFQLIAGHRRIRAARILGWEKIKALIVKISDEEAHKSTLVHNEGRKDQCDYRKAKMHREAIVHGFAKTQTEVAAMFATKQSHVSRCQKMLALPLEIRTFLDEKPDLFSSTTAEVITQLLQEYPDQVELIRKGVERIKEGAPENSIKGWVSQKQSAQSQSAKPKSTRPKVITDRGGRQLYTARLSGRVIELRLSSPDIDAEDALEKLIQHLKDQVAETPDTKV